MQGDSKKAMTRQDSTSLMEKTGFADNAVVSNRTSALASATNGLALAPSAQVTPDDFASALQKSIDDLQTRLSSLSNPITNFAVKEFRIDAPVVFSVTNLGTVLYRFLTPEENIPPAAISRIALTLIPIEKRSSARSLPDSLFKVDKTLDELTGIDAVTIETLKQLQIYTVNDLWQIGSRASARANLESMLKMGREKLSSLISQAELLLIKGIGKAEVQILFKVGIMSLADLSKFTPDELVLQYNRAIDKGTKIGAEEALNWINASRSYAGAAKYTEVSSASPL